jgi:hypothetical protein
MRSRRPYLFSDTEAAEQAQLDRHTFEYHLETLTNRKQELDFEHFARKLVEKELCPNLLPQTGPTGGGDSKVDSETYPVSSDISDRWYYAAAKGREGSNERWVFAFSTKEDWKTKVRDDIKSIAGTEREVEYDESIWATRDAHTEKRLEMKLKRQAKLLGYQLVPMEQNAA